MIASNASLLLASIFLPILSCPLLALTGRLKGRAGWLALVFPLLSTLAIARIAGNLGWGTPSVFEFKWIPTLGTNLSLLFDGLSTFFGLVVSGMGIVITFYARFYLGEKYKDQNRFYAYLMLFMGAMLLTVFANNLMLLFIAWEITGLASYFLIGFFHDKAGPRRGARQALLVTSTTGLAMLVAVVITGRHTGTYDISVLIREPGRFGLSPAWMNVAFVFFMVAAFGKSAQFPFHFWLPGAMAAPTPVSAYLHAATMVKLGLFLTARLYPFFVTAELWQALLIPIGFLTMIVGSVFALLSNDLKTLLAYSTVSQLGFVIGFYGMGNTAGVAHDYFHIVNHVFYKGSLFMIAGIVDHVAGTRDIRKLGGLWRRMPLTAVACIIAALGMAGIPGTTGFISKELMLTQIFQTVKVGGGGIYWLLPVGITVSAIAMVAFSIRLFKNVFFGRPVGGSLKKPGFLFELPAALPAVFVLMFGLFPGVLGHFLDRLSVPGLQAAAHTHLALWHGVNPSLLLSLAVIGLGLGVYAFGQRQNWGFTRIPSLLRFDDRFESLYHGFINHAGVVTRFLRSHRPGDYLPIIITMALVIVCGYLATDTGWIAYFKAIPLRPPGFLASLTFAIIVVGIVGTVVFKHWIRKLISLSVTGFMITFYFVLYRAPDLALTQILIETVSLVLILLFLTRLPKSEDIKNQKAQLSFKRKSLAILCSVTMAVWLPVLILIVTGRPAPDPIGDYFIQNTVSLAQGNNAVNTILVDFRGYDTMGEITVLIIAMLGALGLVMRKKRAAQ